jgi:hypothetical protein
MRNSSGENSFDEVISGVPESFYLDVYQADIGVSILPPQRAFSVANVRIMKNSRHPNGRKRRHCRRTHVIFPLLERKTLYHKRSAHKDRAE